MKRLSLATILFFTSLMSQSQTKNFIDQPYIEVNGNADTLLTPNEIFIKIITSEKDTKDRTSIEELEIKMVAALKSMGINIEKDLTTSDMISNFRSYLLKSKDVLKTKQYILKVGDAIMASKVFIQLEDLGISNISIDRVHHSDIENIKNFMRTKAVENAKVRAIALTKPLNQVVGSAINIFDNEIVNGGGLQGRLPGIQIRGTSSFSADKIAELPKIEFEKLKIATYVNVKFILK